MKNFLKIQFLTAFLIALSACSSGTTVSSDPPVLGAGPYTGTISLSDRSGTIVFNLNSTAAGTVTGIVTINGINVGGTNCFLGGTVDGDGNTLSGFNLNLSVSDNGGSTITFALTASDSELSGNFTATAGACEALSGTVSASR